MSWGQRIDAILSRWMERPIVLRPLKLAKPNDWMLKRIQPPAHSYWTVMGTVMAVLIIAILTLS